MCKVKSVHSVNGMMPCDWTIRPTAQQLNPTNFSVECSASEQKELDKEPARNIIIFTYAYGRFASVQTKLPARAGYAQSAAAGRPARSLQGQRVFRCRRSVAGQVRNAPPGRGRQSANQPGGESLRILAAIVLSVSGCVRAGRPRGSAPAEARTTIRPQADARTDELRRAIAPGRAGHFQFSTDGENCRTFRRLSSPAQHRPATPASKKTPVSAEPAAVSSPDSRLVGAYEELRAQAVAGWRRGPGLALMLTRGFRCWMEASRQLLDSASASQVPACRAENPLTTDLRNEVVIVLAGMLLHRASKVIV